jgi:hypothetical protein
MSGADARRKGRSRRADRLPRRRRRVAPRQDRQPGRPSSTPTRPPAWSTAAGMVYGRHADVVELGRERRAQGLLPRARRRARPALPAAPAPGVAARESRPDTDDVQCAHPPRGVREGRRIRRGVPGPLRGSGLLREALPALGDVRLEPPLGALPAPRGA